MQTLFACLVWLMLPGWIVYLVGQMVMGEIDALTGFIVILLCLFIGLNMYGHPDPAIKTLAMATVVLTVVLWFPLRALMDRGADREMLVSQIEMTYERLNANPNDVVAQFRLARQFEQLGRIDFAAALAARVAPNLPRHTFREEHQLAQRWQMIAAHRRSDPISCVQCRFPIRAGAIGCPSCGRAFAIDLAQGRNGRGGGARKILAVWAILLAVLIGVPSLASYGPTIAIPGSLLLFGAAVTIVVLAFRPTASA